MRISVFGLGYVGTVTAGCLARDGHSVIGVDVNPEKVGDINAGRSPIIEPGLAEIVRESVDNGRLVATTEAGNAVRSTDLALICVGTPSNSNGSLNLEYVERVCENIGRILATADHPFTVVVRSTVVPRTTREGLLPILEAASGRTAGDGLGLGMNPEFLREGSAVSDYDAPSYVVAGQLDEASGDSIAQIYERVAAPLIRTTLETAEMVKYVSNAFHALKVAFANEIGNLCKAHEIDGRVVMDLFCQDEQLNISRAYFRPGFAFGGSCLPKDMRAILHTAKHRDVEVPVLKAVLESNERQIARGIELVERTGSKQIGVLGLSFKAGTDDVRESPVVPLVETLVGRGYSVRIFDDTLEPSRLIGANKAFLERELPHIASLMRASLEQVVEEAEVLVVTNGSCAYRRAFELARKHQTVIDLVGNQAHPNPSGEAGYEGICW